MAETLDSHNFILQFMYVSLCENINEKMNPKVYLGDNKHRKKCGSMSRKASVDTSKCESEEGDYEYFDCTNECKYKF